MTLRESDTLREPVLRASGVTKHFGPVRALNDVSIEVFAGDQTLGTGIGNSKQSAAQSAARAALEHLDRLAASDGSPT